MSKDMVFIVEMQRIAKRYSFSRLQAGQNRGFLKLGKT